ncbi:FAD-dependent monooxygenase [Mesorhizobium sp. B3-1-3]|uniref:FAD-dependent monooxygenase n=1 Tax=unclassified Mesorhizobium TaxID=325217 RepID=UPI00112AD8C2|nr:MULTISPECIES: NAD(P)/FAD-dependent oxidoreductase [unclassified Mesorhizobium]TPI70815.1 FAD-dependent monooxygenase [Mesorhizobium sp. B3-1-8]TPI74429.1 FAD-dependent monooxygenase [Mesorhizobium sp. B3-1-3]
MSTAQGRETPAVRAGAAEVEVAIVGAGLAGTSLAAVLGKAGRKVALVDPHLVHHDEFRAEKIGMKQMQVFEKLGLGPAIRPLVTPMTDIHVFRLGQFFRRERKWEFAFSYGALVNGMRQALPRQVPLTVGKVAEVSTGPDRQRLVLTDGSVIDARLLVVATGYGEAVRRAIGIERVEESKAHSLSIGFDLAITPQQCAYPALACYARNPADRVAYLSVFPIGDRMRGNMFAYRTVAEEWTRAFRENPQKMLCELMPEIARQCGNFAVAGAVEVRQVSLTTTRQHRRAGVVTIGDAFWTTCPTPGIGINRVVTDVDRLASTYIPQWLSTPGMDAEKICAFYDDPVKVATDKAGMRSSIYAKRITIETGLEWRLRRLRNNTARQLAILGRKMRDREELPAPSAA